MALVKIYLKSGQTITLKESSVVADPGSEGVGFLTPDGTRIFNLDQDQIVAVTSEDEWS